MIIKEIAIQYYPRFWSIKRIEALVVAGKLTDKDKKEIIGEE